jgi:DmsE family decaheme c-type cytochrome
MRRVLLYAGFYLLLFALVKPSLAQSAAKPPVAASPAQLTQGPSGDYVGSETCAACHDEISKKFASNPHSRLALQHGDQGGSCESCHGPGKAHVDGGGDITKIRQLSKLSVEQVDETCLGCHAGQHPNFERSKHAEAGVGCLSCHSVHKSNTKADLLKADQPTLCFTCHTNVRPSFSQAFHHKVNEGLVKCSDCHDTHGTFQDAQLRTTEDQNAICTKCHSETAGPFAFEHPVVKTEGCIACHAPHGSPNPRMLKVSNVNTLCLQCHSSVNLAKFPAASSEQGGPAHNQATQYVSCTTCHTQIHGSNTAINFFR